MDFPELVVFILPAYVSNSVPVLFKGNTPIDFGERMRDGNRFLGKGKTFRGFVAGVITGTLSGVLLAYLFPSVLPLLGVPGKAGLSFLLALGAMIGDVSGSFIKRRLHVPSGGKIRFLDQLPFLFVALLLAMLAFPALAQEIRLEGLVFLAVLTVFLHRSVNWAAHLFRLKEVPW